MHKFYLGQQVHYDPPQGIKAPRGAYVVIAKLPERTGQFEYRIRNMNGRHERIARGSELQTFPEKKK